MEKVKKSKKIMILILITFLILLLIGLVYFNIKQINTGRKIKVAELINQEYQSTDENYYINFISEEKLYIKLTLDDEKISETKEYRLEDGMIKTSDEEKMILINHNKVFCCKYNKMLFLLN